MKNETKHTSGQWVVDAGGDGEIEIWSKDREDTIALIAPDAPLLAGEEDRANARLIVRAVNAHKGLLEALKDAVDRMHRASDLLNGDPNPSEIQQAYNALYAGKQRKAIAKAEGGGG